MNPRAMAWLGLAGRGEAMGLHPAHRLKMAAAQGGWGGPGGGREFDSMVPPGLGGPGGGRGFGFARGPKVQRGDVRAGVLALLAEQPRNGYQIIQEVAERSGGVWRPSAGSVYPVLQQLEDEGLARPAESGSSRLFELTEDGRNYVEQHPEQCAAPWETVRDNVGEDAMELRDLLGQVFMAARQVLHAGSASQTADMRRVLTETRRSLYQILAKDDTGDDEGDTSSSPS